MPFDNPNTRVEIATNEEELAIIDEMKRILARRENWTVGSTHKVFKPRLWRKQVDQYCAIGALIKIDGSDVDAGACRWWEHTLPGVCRVYKRIQEIAGVELWELNDRDGFDAVHRVLDRAYASFE